jgi:hypothetical protein
MGLLLAALVSIPSHLTRPQVVAVAFSMQSTIRFLEKGECAMRVKTHIKAGPDITNGGKG